MMRIMIDSTACWERDATRERGTIRSRVKVMACYVLEATKCAKLMPDAPGKWIGMCGIGAVRQCASGERREGIPHPWAPFEGGRHEVLDHHHQI